MKPTLYQFFFRKFTKTMVKEYIAKIKEEERIRKKLFASLLTGNSKLKMRKSMTTLFSGIFKKNDLPKPAPGLEKRKTMFEKP